jgi:hypothetical protein
MGFFVYILYSEKCDKYYTGHTEFLERSLKNIILGREVAFQVHACPGNFFTARNIQLAVKQ